MTTTNAQIHTVHSIKILILIYAGLQIRRDGIYGEE